MRKEYEREVGDESKKDKCYNIDFEQLGIGDYSVVLLVYLYVLKICIVKIWKNFKIKEKG